MQESIRETKIFTFLETAKEDRVFQIFVNNLEINKEGKWMPGMWKIAFPFFLFFVFFSFIYISWRLIILQYCSVFCHTLIWISHGFACSPSWTPLPPPSPSSPSGSSQCTSPELLSYASNLCWRCVSQLITYMFQCYSLRSSHPRLLPQSPKVCSIHVSHFLSCI